MNRYKDIYVLPHSHFDYGYTHPQAMLMELQKDYLTDAIRLCLETRDLAPEERFKWTIEANYVLTKWLEDASDEDVTKLRLCLDLGLIAITALPYHTTPLADLPEQVLLFDEMRTLEERLGYKIRTAINHDVNGQPWSMQQLLQDAGIDFYLTGINIHYGGIPFERPQAFSWEGSDGGLLTSFLGEHYSLFSQFVHSENIPTLLAGGESDQSLFEAMRVDLERYENVLATRSWDKPFYMLTMTNPPLYDNNGPDHFLTEVVSIYNRMSEDQTIHLITVDMWREIVLREFPADELTSWRGDWTDYWNFGAASTPAETRVHKESARLIHATNYLNSIYPAEARTSRSLDQAQMLNRFYAEHTWGAAESIHDPGSDMTKAQRTHKDNLAWDASALAAYALGTALETANLKPGDFSLADTDTQIVLDNPTPYPISQYVEMMYPVASPAGTSLEALRIKDRLPYRPPTAYTRMKFDLPAFSRRVIPIAEVGARFEREEAEGVDGALLEYDGAEGKLLTASYRLDYDPETGRIDRLEQTRNGHVIEGGEFGFASIVRETIACGQENHRSSFFPRGITLGNYSLSVWNYDWQGERVIPSGAAEVLLDHQEGRTVFTRSWHDEIGAEKLAIDLIFYTDSDKIDIDVRMDLVSPVTPISYYLSLPTDVGANWTGHYDTGGVAVRLDEDQMGNVSKDWITLDNYYAVHDNKHGYYLAAPDARLLQPAGFGFGRMSETIARDEAPLVLPWLASNYWETNFAASFGGRLSYRFGFKPFTSFDPLHALKLTAETQPSLLLSVARGSLAHGDAQPDETHYGFRSELAALQLMKPVRGGLLLAVRNLNLEHTASFEFRSLAREFRDVARSNVFGDKLEPMNHGEHRFTDRLARGKLAFYLVEIEGG